MSPKQITKICKYCGHREVETTMFEENEDDLNWKYHNACFLIKNFYSKKQQFFCGEEQLEGTGSYALSKFTFRFELVRDKKWLIFGAKYRVKICVTDREGKNKTCYFSFKGEKMPHYGHRQIFEFSCKNEVQKRINNVSFIIKSKLLSYQHEQSLGNVIIVKTPDDWNVVAVGFTVFSFLCVLLILFCFIWKSKVCNVLKKTTKKLQKSSS